MALFALALIALAFAWRAQAQPVIDCSGATAEVYLPYGKMLFNSTNQWGQELGAPHPSCASCHDDGRVSQLRWEATRQATKDKIRERAVEAIRDPTKLAGHVDPAETPNLRWTSPQHFDRWRLDCMAEWVLSVSPMVPPGVMK